MNQTQKILLVSWVLCNSKNYEADANEILWNHAIDNSEFYTMQDYSKDQNYIEPDKVSNNSYWGQSNGFYNTFASIEDKSTRNHGIRITKQDKGEPCDRTKHNWREKNRDKLSKMELTEYNDKVFRKNDILDLINKGTKNFKEQAKTGMVIDKLSLHFNAKYLNVSVYRMFCKKGPITMKKIRNHAYIHIHSEAYHLFSCVKDVINTVLTFLNKMKVFDYRLSALINNTDSNSLDSLIPEYFKLNELELAFDFPFGYNITDFIDISELYCVNTSDGISYYSVKDYRPGLVDKKTGKVIKKKQKSLLIIYHRGSKTKNIKHGWRIELRLTRKYITGEAYKFDFNDFLDKRMIDLAYCNRNMLGKALELACGKKNIFMNLSKELSYYSQYYLLKYIIDYAFVPKKEDTN